VKPVRTAPAASPDEKPTASEKEAARKSLAVLRTDLRVAQIAGNRGPE
jgi:hypothetical protein